VRLDHISYAAGADGIAAAAQRLGSALGAGFTDGGMHPSFGTRNFILPLTGGVYLEVVGALEHPASDKAPFGQAVRQRTARGGGWLAWVVAVDDIEPVEQRLGRRSVEGHRRRPDGVELRWRQVGVLDVLDDPALPFFIQWADPESSHPAAVPTAAATIQAVEICGDPDTVAQWLGGPLDSREIDVRWVHGERPGVVAVEFLTPRGTVRID
jgi:glyoxalase-like protein